MSRDFDWTGFISASYARLVGCKRPVQSVPGFSGAAAVSRSLLAMAGLLLISVASGQCQSAHTPKPTGKSTMTDADFAKSAFTALANGNQSVAGDIDWEHFKVSGQDVGSKYNSFSDEPNHAAFRKAFISSFSKSFKGTGARAETLTNWTVKNKDANQSTVTGQTLQKTHLVITLSKRGGVKRMSGIQSGP